VIIVKTQDEISQLEAYVYDETQENLYAHHDLMLPNFHLCMPRMARLPTRKLLFYLLHFTEESIREPHRGRNDKSQDRDLVPGRAGKNVPRLARTRELLTRELATCQLANQRARPVASPTDQS
jgi:hypothetical protein